MKTRRHGFVMVVAIVLLGLIGVALASLTEQFGSDLKRLRAQTDEAQGRQILIAATRALASDPDKAFALPAPLTEAGAALKISPTARQAGQAIFRLDVITGKIHSTEVLTLKSQGQRWTITDAELQ